MPLQRATIVPLAPKLSVTVAGDARVTVPAYTWGRAAGGWPTRAPSPELVRHVVQRRGQHACATRGVFGRGVLRGAVRSALDTRHEEHRGRHASGHDLAVVAGAADHRPAARAVP